MNLTLTLPFTQENVMKLQGLFPTEFTGSTPTTTSYQPPHQAHAQAPNQPPHQVNTQAPHQANTQAPYQAPNQPPHQAPNQAPPQVDVDIQTLGAEIVQANRKVDLEKLFAQYGIQKITDIYEKPEWIAPFTAALKSLHGGNYG